VLYLAHSITLYLKPNIVGVETGEKGPLTSTALARAYATRTFLFSIVRLYASFNILESPLYDLSLATFAIELVCLVNDSMVFGYIRKDSRLFLHFALVVTMVGCSLWCRPYHVGWEPLDIPCY
jgi:hypothetical protein